MRWWRDSPIDEQAIESKYGPRIDGLVPVEVFVIELDGIPVGFIQRCIATEYAEWTSRMGYATTVAIDYLIGEETAIGLGAGTLAIRGFVPLSLERYAEADAVIAVPESDNAASCRALEKAGFSCVFEGTLESERTSRIYVSPRTAG